MMEIRIADGISEMIRYGKRYYRVSTTNDVEHIVTTSLFRSYDHCSEFTIVEPFYEFV